MRFPKGGVDLNCVCARARDAHRSLLAFHWGVRVDVGGDASWGRRTRTQGGAMLNGTEIPERGRGAKELQYGHKMDDEEMEDEYIHSSRLQSVTSILEAEEAGENITLVKLYPPIPGRPHFNEPPLPPSPVRAGCLRHNRSEERPRGLEGSKRRSARRPAHLQAQDGRSKYCTRYARGVAIAS